MKIGLTREELNYLVNNLLKDNQGLLFKLKFENNDQNCIKVELEEEVADDIRELASDEVGLHFDENYLPTSEGWMLEHLIDKFFTG
jgi:hypothetical protein